MLFQRVDKQSIAGPESQLSIVYQHTALAGENVIGLLCHGMIVGTGGAARGDDHMAEAVVLGCAYMLRRAQHLVYPFPGGAQKGLLNLFFSCKPHVILRLEAVHAGAAYYYGPALAAEQTAFDLNFFAGIVIGVLSVGKRQLHIGTETMETEDAELESFAVVPFEYGNVLCIICAALEVVLTGEQLLFNSAELF